MQGNSQKVVSQGLQTTLQKRSGLYPERTYQGRERVSRLPKWLLNWLMLGVFVYAFGGTLLDLFGVSWSWGVISKPAEVAELGSVEYKTPTPDIRSPDNSYHVTSGSFPEQIAAATVRAMSVQSTAVSYISTVQPVQPTYTPRPTLTPYPTQRPFFGELKAVGYSYYWPPYGGVNCHPENWHDNFCEDVTASGLRWTEYIGRGVAVPVQWVQNGDVEYGDTLRVHSPIEMQGDYIILDACGGCVKPEGHVYVDFLDSRKRLNWTVPLLIEIIKK